MKLNWIKRQNSPARSVALGTFDGVHLGHQKLLQEAIARKTVGGTSCVFTFDIPPEQYFRGRLRLVSSFESRVELFLSFGIDEVAWLPFGPQFTSMTAQDFVTKILVEELLASEVVCGYDYHFGSKRGGDAKYLKEQGKLYGFSVTVVPPVQTEGGQTIGSTGIRELLAQGQLAQAVAHLGYYPAYLGTVVPGRGNEARRVTIKIDPALVLPKEGLYLAWLVPGNKGAFAIASVYGASWIELFLFDSDGAVDTQVLEVQFLHRLREGGIDQLTDSDLLAARQLLPGFHLQDTKVVLR
ncbi:MAG TPA: hypothetical protein DDW87_13990 [Firmicutes bacterium]|nr:hypothetical protein [Bacillota bacterium]